MAGVAEMLPWGKWAAVRGDIAGLHKVGNWRGSIGADLCGTVLPCSSICREKQQRQDDGPDLQMQSRFAPVFLLVLP
jgi:hypothetical protein